MMLKAPFLFKIRIFFSVPENFLNAILSLLLENYLRVSAHFLSSHISPHDETMIQQFKNFKKKKKWVGGQRSSLSASGASFYFFSKTDCWCLILDSPSENLFLLVAWKTHTRKKTDM